MRLRDSRYLDDQILGLRRYLKRYRNINSARRIFRYDRFARAKDVRLSHPLQKQCCADCDYVLRNTKDLH